MYDNNFLRELSERLSRLLPAAEELRNETRNRIEQTLKDALGNLDVLTTEEFSTRTRALQRAEDRIAELENLVADMEARLADLESSQESSD